MILLLIHKIFGSIGGEGSDADEVLLQDKFLLGVETRDDCSFVVDPSRQAQPGFFGVDYVHKFAEDLAHAGTRIPAAGIRSRHYHTLNRSIFFALIGYVVFEVLYKFLVVEILGVAHV